MDGAAPPKLNADGAAAGVEDAGVEVPKVVVVEGPQVTMVFAGDVGAFLRRRKS